MSGPYVVRSQEWLDPASFRENRPLPTGAAKDGRSIAVLHADIGKALLAAWPGEVEDLGRGNRWQILPMPAERGR